MEKDRDRQLLVSVEVDDFSEYIEISKKRRPIPYIKGKCRIPKKYQDESLFGFDKKGRLCLLETGEILVKNKQTVGKPRYKKINGQDIYNGNNSRQSRAALVKNIHNYFLPILKDIEIPKDVELYPLTLELLFYVHDQGKSNIDNDNKWIWRKCIQDVITELEKWPDDNVNIISRNEEETILISEEATQKLIINIYGKRQKV